MPIVEPLRVGHEQIVADELDLVADQVGQRLPALEIVLGHAVLDREDRVALRRGRRDSRPSRWRRAILPSPADLVLAVLEELGRGAIEREHRRRRPACSRPSRSRLMMKSSASLVDWRCSARSRPRRRPLVARPLSCRPFFSVWKISDAAAHRLGQRRRADRHDHEFLEVDRVVGMLAAVDDVHHRHRQDMRRDAADIAIERQAARVAPRPWRPRG